MKRSAHLPRVALLSQYPGGSEDDMIRGVFDYLDGREVWDIQGWRHLPFRRFESFDLEACDAMLGSFFEQRWAEAALDAGLKVVDTGDAIAERVMPRVTHDSRATGRLGAEHLLTKGFAHLAFLSLGKWWTFEERRAGFIEFMDNAGREYHTEAKPDMAVPERTDWCVAWLDRLPKPIGVMVAADFTAVYVVEAARRLGLRVPDDVAVLGVGSDPWVSNAAGLSISTVRTDSRQVGLEAARLLDGLLRGEEHPPQKLIPPLGVVEAQSTDTAVSEDELVERALRYIRDHVSEPINVEDVLGELEVSRATLVKRMRTATGRTPHEALTRARIERAKQLLLTTDAKLVEIARRCGFLQQSHLQRVFKRHVGITPGRFRSQHASRQTSHP